MRAAAVEACAARVGGMEVGSVVATCGEAGWAMWMVAGEAAMAAGVAMAMAAAAMAVAAKKVVSAMAVATVQEAMATVVEVEAGVGGGSRGWRPHSRRHAGSCHMYWRRSSA